MRYTLGYYCALAITISLQISSCTPDKTGYPIPTTYTFDNVNYTGQTNRLNMMAEITSYLKTANEISAPALDAVKIKDMYGDNTGNYFSTPSNLNSATQQLKDKTISTEQNNFEIYMDSLATASLSTSVTASNGQAGILSNNSGSKHYLLNNKGIELTQVIEKGLMGACFYYQATAVYMGASKMNTETETMEHHWDEMFGYFGAATDFPETTSTAVFWSKYCNSRESIYPLNTKIMNAMLRGRASISANDLTTRDEMITEVRIQWELIAVTTAISYMNEAQQALGTDNAISFHAMSEVFGFIMSLKYGSGSGAITNTQIDTILTDLYGSSDPLEANNYNLTTNKIDDAKTALVNIFTELSSVKDTL